MTRHLIARTNNIKALNRKKRKQLAVDQFNLTRRETEQDYFCSMAFHQGKPQPYLVVKMGLSKHVFYEKRDDEWTYEIRTKKSDKTIIVKRTKLATKKAATILRAIPFITKIGRFSPKNNRFLIWK